MEKTDNFMTQAYPWLFIVVSILLNRTAMSAVKPLDALLWLIPAVFGAYFLCRLLYCLCVEKRLSYRFLLIVLVSVFGVFVYA